MYISVIKPLLDFICALIAIIVLLPLLLVLTIVGVINMKGNPFFTQPRPGKNEKIFKLIKFRSMTNQKDSFGNFLPDDVRLTKYGKWLRSTSLDELPELINILVGQMSFVGPRPLLVSYLPLYNDFQRKRHVVRPGITGLAQVGGRNALSWDEKFALDVKYTEKVSLLLDVKILFQTLAVVFKRRGISSASSATMEPFLGNQTMEKEVAN